LTAWTIRIFRIGPSLRIESRIGRTIRNRIESRSFAGPYFKPVFLSIFQKTSLDVLQAENVVFKICHSDENIIILCIL